ncbi:MAG TPA: oligosaccharide flippase family protein [Terriglobales bacterium]|jgi:O-antigen/teichoic acid export membrane protein|nr:oligosaccharide flippase family protein [Terriglobales bacterium]
MPTLFSAEPPPPSNVLQRPIGTKIIHNVASGLIRLVVVAPVPFLLTPFLLRHLGTQGFGAWAVFLSINSLTSLADIGVMGTLTKHVSQHYTRQDYTNLNKVVNAGLLIFLVVASLGVLAVNLAAGLLASAFFRNLLVSHSQSQFMIRLLTASIALNLLSYPFSSVISGLQRLDVVNLLWALNTVITASGAALFVSLGLGIEGLVYAIVLTSSVLFVLNVWTARHLLPQLRVQPTSVQWSDIKELSAFSTQIYVTQMATAVYIHTEKLLLAHFTGLTAAGWYDIANDLAMKIRNFPALLMTPLMPAASELDARQDHDRAEELYYRAHKYLAFVGVGMFLVVALQAHRFVELWLGPGFTGTARALIVLTGVQVGNLACAPALFILIGKGILRPAVRFAVIGMTGTLLVSTTLIALFGFTGALYGTSISVLGAAAYLVFLFHQETGYAKRRLLRIYAKPAVLGLCLAGLSADLFPISKFNWREMIGFSLAIAVVYGSVLVLLHYFDDLDLQVVERFIRVPKGLRKSSLFS